MGRIFDLGVRKGHTILIWGYAKGFNFDLGVRGYQKVENPCFTIPASSLLLNNLTFGLPMISAKFGELQKDLEL